VAVAPPFWGLFWAIVQPAERRRSLEQEQESHLMKMERLRQEAEIKRLKAEANAQLREVQLKGLAATVRTARAQLAGSPTEDAPGTTVTPDVETPADAVPALPSPGATGGRSLRPATAAELEAVIARLVGDGDVTNSRVREALQDAGFSSPDNVTLARAIRRALPPAAPSWNAPAAPAFRRRRGDETERGSGRPLPGSPQFDVLVSEAASALVGEGRIPSAALIASRIGYDEQEVLPAFQRLGLARSS
jgi:hypothetical protein